VAMSTRLEVLHLGVGNISLELLDKSLDLGHIDLGADDESTCVGGILLDENKALGNLLIGDLLGLSGLGKSGGLLTDCGSDDGGAKELLDALGDLGMVKVGELDAEMVAKGLDGGGDGDDGDGHFDKCRKERWGFKSDLVMGLKISKKIKIFHFFTHIGLYVFFHLAEVKISA